jgi:hypothetical protein
MFEEFHIFQFGFEKRLSFHDGYAGIFYRTTVPEISLRGAE